MSKQIIIYNPCENCPDPKPGCEYNCWIRDAYIESVKKLEEELKNGKAD